jgi:hypothetical protein
MVSKIVEELRKIDVHPVVVTPVSGSNRHERREEEAKAHQYRELAKRKSRNWRAKRKAARRQAAASRKRNR